MLDGLLHVLLQISFISAVTVRPNGIDHQPARAVTGRHGDGRNFLDARNESQYLFNFGRADLDATQIHCVIGAAENTPISISQFLRLVTVPAQGAAGNIPRCAGKINVVMFLVEQRG